MAQCTHKDCTEQALPGSNRCAMHAMEGSRSDKMSELADMGDVAEGSGLGGLGRSRAPTAGFGSVYGYLTGEFKATPARSRTTIVIVVVGVVAAVVYYVMRMAPASYP